METLLENLIAWLQEVQEHGWDEHAGTAALEMLAFLASNETTPEQRAKVSEALQEWIGA